MNAARQAWLVGLREMRERSRSRAFRISVVIMLVVVVGVLVLPGVLTGGASTKTVGLTGSIPAGLSTAIQSQGDAVGIEARVHRYDNLAAGENAVRHDDIDVLVVDAKRLEWPTQIDDQLRTVVTGAIQFLAVQERAVAAGISPETLQGLVAPVAVANVELGSTANRGPGDQAAVQVMIVFLFLAISVYGNLVLTGVVEEKANRVVEVLLARMPAGSLLAGKVTGIGLLGLAQIALTAAVALAAITLAPSVDIPAVSPGVLGWVVAWFVLGYALYATAYGALGSLASRTEDAQTAAGPVLAVLLVAYFASLATAGEPDSGLTTMVSYLPPTAPMAMPMRLAMGTAAWWEPLVAALVTLVTVAALIRFGGRLYTAAILRSGPTLRLREAWQSTRALPREGADSGAGHTLSALGRLAFRPSFRRHRSAHP
jgi:ABC-2 type transport system permease protein